MTVGGLVPVALRCAHKAAPLAVEADRVSFSWALQGRGRRQNGYQLYVNDLGQPPPPRGPDVPHWDSGRVISGTSTGVAYAGPPLSAGRQYNWKVRVWDEDDKLGPWSAKASFGTALARGEWAACWVGVGPRETQFEVPFGDGHADPVISSMHAAPYLRRAFSVGKDVSHAYLYATALGLYELYVNGQRVTDDVLAPGWTDYDRRLLYQAYDVRSLLVSGENVLGAILADGWACGFFGFDTKRRAAHYARSPQLLAQLLVRYADGREQTVGTDEHWLSSTGSIVYADLLMGERREPALEPTGWACPGYDASSWRPVSRCGLGPQPLLADPGPPVRVVEEIAAKSVTGRPDGKVIVDFGQNMAGWVRVRAPGRPGVSVEVRHGEVLNPDGSLYVDNLRAARQTDSYVTTGAADVLAPRFTFHGFRFAEVSGLDGGAEPSDFTACVVHADTARTGLFECSSPRINQLYSNIDWGQRSNFVSVPTDCPQRDERLGWLGDAQVFVKTAAYNRDVHAFFSKWLDDVADAQLPSGAYSDFAPRLGYDWGGAPAWADAGVIVPWTIYKMYGDKSLLERHFGSMVAWMGFLAANNPEGLWASQLGNNYGDWLAPGVDRTPRELLATAYWAHDATIMTDVAQALGHREKADEYRELSVDIRRSFQKAYLHPDGSLESGTQTAYAIALHMGLVPEPLIPAATNHLVRAIADAEWHLTTGFVGVGYLLPALSSNGRTEVAYRLLEQRSYPSWLYQVDRGATTIWERWDGWTEERGFQSPKMNSFNHYSLGSVGEWLYRFVLGIELAPGAVAFGRLVLRPHPGGSLTYARGSFTSVRGKVMSAWSLEGDRLSVDIELPPNVTATVCLPSASPLDVVGRDGARPVRVQPYPGATGQMEAVFEIGAGSFSFSGPAPEPLSLAELEGGQPVNSSGAPLA